MNNVVNTLQSMAYNTTDVRFLLFDSTPWFVAHDICTVLDIKNVSQAVGKLDEDEKGIFLTDTPGGPQGKLCVNEPGMYALVLSSRKPEAKTFKRWVTHEVLPSIRQTGKYEVGQPVVPQTYIEALEKLLESEKEKQRLEAQAKQLAPKASRYDKLMSADNAQTMEQVAKSFGWGRNNLFRKLREEKVLLKNNLPYQEFLARGYFKVRDIPINRTEGVVNVTQTLVTAKGIDFIARILQPQVVAG